MDKKRGIINEIFSEIFLPATDRLDKTKLVLIDFIDSILLFMIGMTIIFSPMVALETFLEEEPNLIIYVFLFLASLALLDYSAKSGFLNVFRNIVRKILSMIIILPIVRLCHSIYQLFIYLLIPYFAFVLTVMLPLLILGALGFEWADDWFSYILDTFTNLII